MPAPDRACELQDDLRLLEDAVRAAGSTALGYFGNAPRRWTKKYDSPVSEADIAADDVLRERLCGARPDYGWLSEESGAVAGSAASPVWIVDPIDGTRSFLRERPEWTVSVALVADGRPIVASVFNPARDEMFLATRGSGATLNATPIRASTARDLTDARLVAHDSDLKGKRWQRPWPTTDIAQVGSMAYRLCIVAQGARDATVSVSGKSDWDLAAADLILHEAGGRVSAFNGETFVYNRAEFRHPNVVGAGTELHQSILHHIGASYVD